MPGIEMTIEPDLCGPISVGTVAVVRALMTHAGVALEAAVALVDRCTFGGERVTVPVPSSAGARALLDALRQLPAASRISAALYD